MDLLSGSCAGCCASCFPVPVSAASPVCLRITGRAACLHGTVSAAPVCLRIACRAGPASFVLIPVSGCLSIACDQTPQAFQFDQIFIRSGCNIIVALDLIAESAESFGDFTVKGRSLRRIIHRIRSGQHSEFVKKAVLGLIDPFLKGLFSLFFDKFIRIFVRTQVDHRSIKSRAPQYSDISERRPHSRSIAVVSEQYPVGIAVQERGLTGRKSCSQRGDCLYKSGLVHGDDIHVALAENQVVFFAPPGQIQGIQIAPFVEYLCVRGIDILGLAVSQDTSSESDHPASDILDREHDAVPESVMNSLLFIEQSYIRLQNQIIRKSFLSQIGSQVIPGSVREAEPELVERLRRQLPSSEIPHAALSPAGAEQLVIIGRRLLVDREQVLPVLLAFSGLLTQFPDGKRDAGPVRQLLQRLREGAVVVFHQESDRASSRSAAEAVIHVFARNHSERRCLFIMKGTQTDIVLPSFFQMNMGGDHVHDIRIREDLVHNLLRVIHPEYFSSLKAGTLPKPCPSGNTGYAGSFLSGFHPQPCPSVRQLQHRPCLGNEEFLIFCDCEVIGHGADIVTDCPHFRCLIDDHMQIEVRKSVFMCEKIIVKHLDQLLCPGFFRLGNRIRIDLAEHKGTHILQSLCGGFRHGDDIFVLAVADHVMNEKIQSLPDRLSRDIRDFPGYLLFGEEPCPHGVIHIVVQICYFVREPDDLTLQRRRGTAHLVIEDSVPDLPAQIQSLAVPFQDIHDPEALLIVFETKGTYTVERPFTAMAEGRVAQIMTQRNGLDQILVEAEGFRDRPGILGHFQRVGQTGPVMVACRRQKNLSLILEPSKRFAVQDSVPVPLKGRSYIARLFFLQASSGFFGQTCPGRQNLLLSQFKFLPDCHIHPLLPVRMKESACIELRVKKCSNKKQ